MLEQVQHIFIIYGHTKSFLIYKEFRHAKMLILQVAIGFFFSKATGSCFSAPKILSPRPLKLISVINLDVSVICVTENFLDLTTFCPI